MDSFIMINGFVLWVALALVILIAVGFIAIGSGYLEEHRKNARLETANRYIEKENSRLIGEKNRLMMQIRILKNGQAGGAGDE